MQKNIRITGVMFYYYFVCKRKLWYFYHNIEMEHNSDDVTIGKLVDESSYSREKKHIMIDDVINIDYITSRRELHEVKKSRSIKYAGHWQLKYYLYYLKKKGVTDISGVVDYPLLRKKKRIQLTNEDEQKIDEILNEIEIIVIDESVPEVINKSSCKKCSYYELCYI